MKCFMFNQWKRYVNDELSPAESEALELHVEQCPQCQGQLQEWVLTMQEVDFSTLPDAYVPDSFTDEVMDKLFDAVPAQFERKNSSRTRRQRGWNIMRKTGLAVAGLAALIATGTVVSPTFANYVNSLFHMGKDADRGMKNAVDQGFVQKQVQKVTDQGITVEAKELLVDSMRIAVIYDVYDQNGKQIPKKEHSLDSQLFDSTGKDLKRGSESNGAYGDYFMLARPLHTVFESAEATPDQLTLKLSATEIAGKSGTWELVLPIDMKKTKEATKTVTFENTVYESPQGLALDLKKIEFSPSATRIMLESTYTKAAQEARAKQLDTYRKNLEQGKTIGIEPMFLPGHMGGDDIAYEITNEQGEVVAAWDHGDLDDGIIYEKNVLPTTSVVGTSEGDKMKWWHTFEPIQGNQKLTLQLKKIYERKPAYSQIELVPAEVMGQKKTVTDGVGNTFTFSSLVIETAPDKNAQGQAVMTVEGKLAKDVVETKLWFVKDENGKEISSDWIETVSTRDKDGRVHFKGRLAISEMVQLPKKLTVSYADYTVEHRDVNWEVPIEIK